MSNGRDFTKIIEAARAHYQNVKHDIVNAKDRIEHIRLTALAQEAHNLLTDLLVFDVGLVYSHVSTGEVEPRTTTFNEEPEDIEQLDLPEFRSPYKPPMQ
jgi:hypothetical protein